MSNEIVCGSFDDHKSYFMSSQYDKKSLLRVKIIKNDNVELFEEKINNILSELICKNDVIDIKYAETSCMIIYKNSR
jgi:hypothetical protein